MLEFLKENAAWVVPIAVAIIGGLFALMKTKSKTSSISQRIKSVKNSNINQIGGNSSCNDDR